MAYILPPEPADSEVIGIYDGSEYTWGQHRLMEKSLAALEASDPAVLAAKQELAKKLDELGIEDMTGVEIILICEHCGKDEIHVHETWCPDYEKDLPITRTAGAYEYLDEYFHTLHTTSAPANDEEAFDYFRIVEVMFPSDTHVRFVKRRELHADEFTLLPASYDWETKQITRGAA